MIHSTETIDRIRELLIISGLPEGEFLEEMMDHYLSDIETQIDLGISPQIAVLSTFQKIELTDFNNLQKKKNLSLYMMLIPIFLLSISIYIYQNNIVPLNFEFGEKSTEIAPDGWPLEETMITITSNFGIRFHPILKSPKLHKGIDIQANIGTPVFATGTAIVKETGFTTKAGNYVILAHNNRFSSRYYHLSSIDVKNNDKVTKGSLIGKVGNTGVSLAPHLHYEILDKGVPLDPLEYSRP